MAGFGGRAIRWAAFPLLAGMAACGGGSEPTAAERAAAEDRWVRRADAACATANRAIAERGWPADLVDLDRLVVRGIDDARSAIRTIVKLPLPEGAGAAPGAFVRELKALDPELTKLSDASEDLEPAALVKAADTLKPRLASLQRRAKAAGLASCLTHEERFFVPDAVRAPVFAQQLAKLDRTLLRRIKRIDFGAATTPGELALAFKHLSEVVETAIEGIDALDPPQWAANQTAGYQITLRDLQSIIQQYSARLVADRGKPLEALDRSEYLRLERELNRDGRAEAKARRRMLRAVGAAPVIRPPEEEAVAPESEQES